MTLPLRVGARVARLSLHTAEEALRLSGGVAEQAIKILRPPARGPEPAPATEAERRPRPDRQPSPPGRSPSPAPPATPPRTAEPADLPPLGDEPARVSREAVVVEEVAEAGAEEGAGAELHVDEPWPDYRQMTTNDIIARLEQADAAELAAVELYEQTHRARQSVLTAAKRRLRTAGSGGGSQPRHERKANHA
jgi:hypothetical protein